MRYGMGNATINVSQLVANQLDLLVIATFLSTKWVTFFYIARTISGYYATFISTVTRTFTPHITHLHTVAENEEMLSFYLRVSKLTALMSTWLAVGIAAYGQPFLSLWVGREYVSGDLYYRSDMVLYLLTSGIFCRTLQSMAWQVLLGTRELPFLTWMNVGEAFANLTISVLLVHRFGLLGVAFGSAAPMWVCYGMIMPLYMVRRYQIGWKIYARAILRPVIFTMALFGSLCGIAVSQYYPDSWVQLLVSASAVSIVFFGLAAVFELTPEERRTIAAKFAFIQRLLPKKSLPV
jgi:O-antigen/teichoic acid export membrane protein